MSGLSKVGGEGYVNRRIGCPSSEDSAESFSLLPLSSGLPRISGNYKEFSGWPLSRCSVVDTYSGKEYWLLKVVSHRSPKVDT